MTHQQKQQQEKQTSTSSFIYVEQKQLIKHLTFLQKKHENLTSSGFVASLGHPHHTMVRSLIPTSFVQQKPVILIVTSLLGSCPSVKKNISYVISYLHIMFNQYSSVSLYFFMTSTMTSFPFLRSSEFPELDELRDKFLSKYDETVEPAKRPLYPNLERLVLWTSYHHTDIP